MFHIIAIDKLQKVLVSHLFVSWLLYKKCLNIQKRSVHIITLFNIIKFYC